MYTRTPGGQFAIDRHPAHPQISFVAGLSGHGFKMSNVLGEIVADFATKGSTEYAIDLLSAERFSKP